MGGLKRGKAGKQKYLLTSMLQGILVLCLCDALTGCGVTVGPGIHPIYTAGVYTYVLTAFDENDPQLTASTTFTVTVPAGL